MKFKSKYRHVSYSKIVRVPDQASALKALKRGVIVLIMPEQKLKSVKLLCPCGCGEIISINVVPETARAWRFTYEREFGISLWPSIWLDTGCKSHFILRRNQAFLVSGEDARQKVIPSRNFKQ